MAEMKRFIWSVRCAVLYMWYIRCRPRIAWQLATAADDDVYNENTPKEAVELELSYWDGE
jgi:hypothetical protein